MMRVLMVDVTVSTVVVRRILEHGQDDPVEVDLVPDFGAAMEVLARFGADVVLVDQRRLADTGEQVMREVRSAWPDLPVVVMAGNPERARSECQEADDYVPKDRVVELLSHAVWSAMERRRAKRRIQQDVADRQERLRRMNTGG